MNGNFPDMCWRQNIFIECLLPYKAMGTTVVKGTDPSQADLGLTLSLHSLYILEHDT